MGRKRSNGSLGMQWFTTCVSTTLVLILLGIVLTLILFARRLSDSVKENLAVTVLVESEADSTSIDALKRVIEGSGYISTYDYISKEQALEEQVKAMGSDPSEFLGANPFTASFELHLNAIYANSDSLYRIASQLRKTPGVEDVIYQKELVDTINDNLRRISYILLGIAALLALVSFALINSTVRLSIHSGRFVIRTMKLVGASWGFIRRPFLSRSFWLGLLSGLLADAAIGGGIYSVLQYDPTLAAYIQPEMLASVGAAVPLFGLLLTLSCTFISVSKYLRMKASELY